MLREMPRRGTYWLTIGAVMSCDLAGCAGMPTQLAAANIPQALAVDGASVYWANYDGTLLKCSVAGCGGSPVQLAPAQSAGAIAVDATSVYFTDPYSGAVMKLTPK
jgi:hypothetical protein